ncbi:hypothetical protein ABPG72_015649 [Tetrahymena utriculariae]
MCSVPNCQKCIENNPFQCETCIQKYFIQNELCAINCQVQNCLEYVKNDNNQCQTCNDNYTLDKNNLCNLSCQISNCLSCISSSRCQQCSPNYNLDASGLCYYDFKVPNCQACKENNQFQCDQCSQNYVLDKNLLCISNCQVSNCQKCNQNNPHQCILCKSSFLLNINDGCVSQENPQTDFDLSIKLRYDKSMFDQVSDTRNKAAQQFIFIVIQTILMDNYQRPSPSKFMLNGTDNYFISGTGQSFTIITIVLALYFLAKAISFIKIPYITNYCKRAVAETWEYGGLLDLLWSYYIYVVLGLFMQFNTFEFGDECSPFINFQVNYLSNTQQACEKCESIFWDTNKQGNHTCKNCGFIQSMGYITYEDQIFKNIEKDDNEKGLSRVLYSDDGQLYIKGVYLESRQKQKQKQEIKDLTLDLFNDCVNVVKPLFQLNKKEIFNQKQDFIQNLDEQIQRIKTNSDAKDFAYNYFFNSFQEFIDLSEQQQLQAYLKIALEIKSEKKQQTFNLSNTLTQDQKLQRIMTVLYPNITEQQLVYCEERLEQIRNLKEISCKQNSLLCLVAYDLLCNCLQGKKIDIKQIAQITQQVLNPKSPIVKEATIKKLYKNLLNTKLYNPNNYQYCA